MGHNINSPQQPRMRLHTVNVPIRRHRSQVFKCEKNRLRPFINERRSCRQDLNRKGYQSLLIYCTKTAQNSQFSYNSEFLVPSALHFLMGSPATRQGHEKLVYRLIHLFSSTEIFSKRRKICSCWRKTRATDHALDLTLCSNWPANAHGTQYQLSPATTHASSHCQRPHQTPSGDRSLTLFASTV